MKRWAVGFAVLLVLVGVGQAKAAVIIETVPVGNPGNEPDTRYETPGYGGVNYTYNIGKYEVPSVTHPKTKARTSVL